MGVLAWPAFVTRLGFSHWHKRLAFTAMQSSIVVRWLWGVLAVLGLLLVLISAAWHTRLQLQESLSRPLVAVSGKPRLTPPLAADAAMQTLRQWPPHSEAERISAEILAQADAMGMIFERAEFQSVPGQSDVLQELRIKLPLKGDYLQIRQFLAHVLHTYPSLALAQCKLQRSDIMQPELEALIEFSLYTRKGGV
ncbi:hypothetical protein [Methylophilus aquaticus]|uniref:Pilus assembly protein PilO n=1 Tax=Methylophilus aquaticus TaxID=1971610 RepID=A0ABT9JS07_9PROT|nr:hypothetical protein [Methylophilus aquaticus]MDP8566905.1 hypothetical protein [Methylophilus aquaticus]